MENFNVKDNVQILNNKNPFFMPGAILSSIASTAPDGWLNCGGQQLFISEYEDLYNSIGTTYNLGGETSGKFRLPNLSVRYLIQRTSTSGTYKESSGHTHPVYGNVALASTSVNHNHPTNNYNNATYISHATVGYGAGGGTDNNPLNANKTGFSSGGASGAGHYHSVNSSGNQNDANATYHSHGMNGAAAGDTSSHSHPSTMPGFVTSAISTIQPPSLVVNYFIKT
jgi:microcystin-dependent protein